MKSVVFAIALAVATASIALAGSVTYIAPQPSGVEAPMANTATNWIIPLAIVAILVLTLSNDNCIKRANASV